MTFASIPVDYTGYDRTMPNACFRRSPFLNSYKTHAICSIFTTVKKCLQYPLKTQVFYASSPKFKKKLKEDRLEKSRATLQQACGEPVTLQTYDGAKLDCMYFSAKKFRRIVEEMGGRFDFIEEKGEKRAVLNIHSNELQSLLEKMHASFDPHTIFTGRILINSKYAPDRPEEMLLRLQTNPPAVTILTQGNACIYEFDRSRILNTLLQGQDCIAFNIRGTGRSTGSPTENKTYTDIDTVYQYLIHEKGFFIQNIIALGYCLGSGPATELASSHPEVNLVLDRSFCRVSNIIADDAVDMVFPQNSSNMVINTTLSFAKKISRFAITHIVN